MCFFVCIVIFLLAFLSPFAVEHFMKRNWGLPVSVRIDEADPQSTDIAKYFATIAERLDAKPERMRVTIHARNELSLPIVLDSDLKGGWIIKVGNRKPASFNLRRRWIADHPVPYLLTGRKRQILHVDPVDNNRFRVSELPPFKIPVYVYAIFSAVAALGFIRIMPEAFAFSIGGTIGCVFSTGIRRFINAHGCKIR